MMRHLAFTVLLVCSVVAARGQTWADSLDLPTPTQATGLRYWYDDDGENAQTVAQTSGTFAFDVSSLYSGLHTLHCQLIDNEGAAGITYSGIFLKTDSMGVSSASSFRYWFDNDAENVRTTAIGNGVQAVDVSALQEGFHHIHYTIACSDGTVSPTVTKYFMLENPGGKDWSTLRLCYLIDDETEPHFLTAQASGNQYHFEIDISEQTDEPHSLNYWLMTNDYRSTPVWTTAFGVLLEDSLVLTRNMTFSPDYRLEHSPHLSINPDNSLVIEGTAGMTLNSVTLDNDLSAGSYAQIMSESDSITVTGDVSERLYTQGNVWYFLCLPFDCDLSRLMNEDGAFYAIRYYDGASRAESGMAQGNWKNYNVRRDVIPMGTGFIYMTSKDAWTRFYAADNETKARLFVPTSTDTSLGLAQNESASFVHRGWNLVGNPYANYYDGGHVDFGKALTLWNGSTYEACYTGDDAFVIRPNQAFFVQCPREGDSAIGFPGAGRQLTATPTSGAKARTARRNPNRRLVNLSLTDQTFTDKTRIVLNEEAREDYELDCDAGKFMSLRPEVPQLYSIGRDGTHYAINERPLSDGKVSLGIYIPEDGEYTISVTRNDAERVRLSDSETGQTVDLDEGGYTFQARKGTYTRRLSLWIDTDATGIIEIASENGAESPASWYTLDGRPLQGQPSTTGVYLVKEGSEVRKVLLK